MASVLVVDDEPDLRLITRLSLEGEGFEVREAATGQEALEHIEADAPDLILLDVMMPGMDGFEVLANLRRRGLAPAARVVIMSCRTSERDHLRGWELGAEEYLTKPFDPDELVERLHQLLRASPEDLRRRRAGELKRSAMVDRRDSAARQTPGVGMGRS